MKVTLRFEAVDGSTVGPISAHSLSSPIYHTIPETPFDTGALGPMTFGDIVIVRDIDAATPVLSEAVAKGIGFARVDIEVREFNTQPHVFQMCAQRAILTSGSLHFGNRSYGNENTVFHELTLQFAKIEWTFAAIDCAKVTRSAEQKRRTNWPFAGSQS